MAGREKELNGKHTAVTDQSLSESVMAWMKSLTTVS
jgi:hypothetical protein